MKRDSLETLVMIILGVVIAACVLRWYEYMYGDWTCAFTRCVRVKA